MGNDGANGLLFIPENAKVIRISDEDLSHRNKKNIFQPHTNEDPLFPPWTDTLFQDVQQWSAGECFFDAVILSMIVSDRYALQSMIKDNLDNTCTVRLYDEKGNPKYYRIDKTDFKPQVSSGIFSTQPYHLHAPWVSYIEKAYAIHSAEQEKNRRKAIFTYITQGGDSEDVLQCFTGRSYKQSFSFKDFIRKIFNTPSDLSFTVEDLDLVINYMDFLILTFLHHTEEEKSIGIIANHSYAILNIAIDRETNEFIIRFVNPWKNKGLYYDEKEDQILILEDAIPRERLSEELESKMPLTRRTSVGLMPQNKTELYGGLFEMRFNISDLNKKFSFELFQADRKSRLLTDLAIYCAFLKECNIYNEHEDLRLYLDYIYDRINDENSSMEEKFLSLIIFICSNDIQIADEDLNTLFIQCREVFQTISVIALQDDKFIYDALDEALFNENVIDSVKKFRTSFNEYFRTHDLVVHDSDSESSSSFNME